MWDSTLVKIIRWILFLPLILISLETLNYGIKYLIIQLFDFDFREFWSLISNEVIFFVVVGFVIIFLPMLFAIVISLLTVSLCPNKKIGGIIYSIFAGINFTILIYQIWTLDIGNSRKIITILIVSSVIILITAYQSIKSSLIFAEDE